MRDAIAWSHDLLDSAQQTGFRRMAVFSGGFTLEAAERVGGWEADVERAEPHPPSDVHHAPPSTLDLIASLVDQSVLRTVERTPGEPRYAMLETVREFGLERLEASGEGEEVRRVHAAYYLALAEGIEPELTGSAQAEGLARLEAEHDNLRAALQWALGGDGAIIGVRLVGALWRFWWLRGYLSEGRAFAEAAVATVRGTAAERAKALYAAGSFVQEQGDYEPASSLLEAGLAAAQEVEDHTVAALCLNELGFIARDQGDYPRAIALHEESLALHRADGDRRGVAVSLGNLGEIAIDRGDYVQGEALMAEVATVFRALGDRQALAVALSNRCEAATRRGDHERARPFCEEALSIYRELEDRQGTAFALMNLARVAIGMDDWQRAAEVGDEVLHLARELGLKRLTAGALTTLAAVALAESDLRRAAALLHGSLELLQRTDNKEEVAATLETMARLSAASGLPERAARFHGAAAALRERIGAPIPPADQETVQRAVAGVQTVLGAESFAAAEATGRRLAQDEAITEALVLAEALA